MNFHTCSMHLRYIFKESQSNIMQYDTRQDTNVNLYIVILLMLYLCVIRDPDRFIKSVSILSGSSSTIENLLTCCINNLRRIINVFDFC